MKTKIHFSESEHFAAVTNAHNTAATFNQLTQLVEAILKAEIKDLEAFKKDYEGELIRMIKETYPKPFDLGLDNETTLKMLSIDLTQINELIRVLHGNPSKINICPKSRTASACENKEPFYIYATTKEQHDKLDFCNKIIEVVNEAAAAQTRNANLATLAAGFREFIFYDPQSNTMMPSHYYILS